MLPEQFHYWERFDSNCLVLIIVLSAKFPIHFLWDSSITCPSAISINGGYFVYMQKLESFN